MIKEEKKNRKPKKTVKQIAMEYLRTVAVSFLIALIFTIGLSLRARNEMIKNIYAEKNPPKIDEKVAKQLVAKSDYIKTLSTKNYNICINVGNIYEMAKEYANAEYAYKLALSKAANDNFTPHLKLALLYIEQGKFDDANNLLNSTLDNKKRALIKYKTRAYMVMGDKYYSIGKFLSAAKAYEKSKYYYNKFAKKDEHILKALDIRIIKAYEEAASIILQKGYNKDAVRFLKKAEALDPENRDIRYKLAIIYTDTEPETAVKYFEKLMEEIPQYIDYDVYNRALMKSATIADIESRPTVAKYYRYKIHSKDLFLNRKVIYKNDVDIFLDSFIVKKVFFRYRLIPTIKIKNVSPIDIYDLKADFVLMEGEKEKERVSAICSSKQAPLYSGGGETNPITVRLGNKIFTKKELKLYRIDLYLYKDARYKTLVQTLKIPNKSFYLSK